MVGGGGVDLLDVGGVARAVHQVESNVVSSTSTIRRSPATSARTVDWTGPSATVSKGSTANSARLPGHLPPGPSRSSPPRSSWTRARSALGRQRDLVPPRGPGRRPARAARAQGTPRGSPGRCRAGRRAACRRVDRATQRLDGGVVRDRQRRRLVFAHLAQPPRRPGALVERDEQLGVELRNLLAELVDLPLPLGHEENVPPARRPVTSKRTLRTCEFPVSRSRSLRAKYAQMLTMRLEHASGKEDVRVVRERMSALAARFPGALREIDRLELHENPPAARRARRGAHRSLRRRRAVDEALALFHSFSRGALVTKRWLRGRKRVDARLQRQFTQSLPALAFPEDARQWGSDLAGRRRPSGRALDDPGLRASRPGAGGQLSARPASSCSGGRACPADLPRRSRSSVKWGVPIPYEQNGTSAKAFCRCRA